MMDDFFRSIGQFVCVTAGCTAVFFAALWAVRWPIRFIYALKEYRNKDELWTAVQLLAKHCPDQFKEFARRNKLDPRPWL